MDFKQEKISKDQMKLEIKKLNSEFVKDRAKDKTINFENDLRVNVEGIDYFKIFSRQEKRAMLKYTIFEDYDDIIKMLDERIAHKKKFKKKVSEIPTPGTASPGTVTPADSPAHSASRLPENRDLLRFTNK